MNREENILGNDFSTEGLLAFALPTMVMMVFLGLYTMVDTVFVSRFVSTDALSAINIVTPVINLMVGLGTMLAAGGNAIISRTMGEGDNGRVRESFTMLFFCGGAAGTVLAATCFLFNRNMMRLAGEDGVVAITIINYSQFLLNTLFMGFFMGWLLFWAIIMEGSEVYVLAAEGAAFLVSAWFLKKEIV